MKKQKNEKRRLNQESDLTIWKEYNSSNKIYPTYGELLFWTWMIILYYLGYARTFFWFILVIFSLVVMIQIKEGWKVKIYSRILRDILLSRGYKE